MKTETLYFSGKEFNKKTHVIFPESRNKKGEYNARFSRNDYLTIFEIDSDIFRKYFEYNKSLGYWITKDKKGIPLLNISKQVTVINTDAHLS